MSKSLIHRLIVVCLAMFLIIPITSAQDSDAIPDSAGHFTIDVDIPISFVNPNIAETVQPYINELIQTFMMYAYESPSGGYISDIPWSFAITSEQFYMTEFVLSIRFDIFEYTGGAHPNSYFKTMMVDTMTGEEITWDDIFQSDADVLGALQPLIRDALNEQMEDLEGSEDWITEGTQALTDFQNYVMTIDEMIFYFPPYQVAPYAYGPSEVHIPLSDLSDVLAMGFGGTE